MRTVACATARRLAAAGLLILQMPVFGSIVGYWRFEEGTGTVSSDQTSLFDGQLVNFEETIYEGWSSDVFASLIPQTGQANTGSILMQGGSEFIDLSNGQAMNLGTSFTVEFFMKPDQPVVGSTVFSLTPLSGLGLSLTESLGTLYWNMGFNAEAPYTQASGVEVGVWQHVALVKEPGQYSLYINGLLIAVGPVGVGGDGPYSFPGTDITGDRTIGGENGTWRGYLDEFRISDTALTPDQFLIVPEPGTMGLVGLGGLALLAMRRGRIIRKSSHS